MAAVNVTFPGNLAQVKTANDLRSVPSTLLPLGALFLVNGLEGLFEYDPGSVEADDGKDVLRPYDKTPGQVGRWLRNVDGLATGPEGPTGPANSTYTTLAGLKAASVSNASYIFAPPSGSDGGTAAGTFLYQTAGAPYTADGVNVIRLDAVPLTTGALVRQGVSQVAFSAPSGGTDKSLDQDLRRYPVYMERYGVVGYPSRAAAEAAGDQKMAVDQAKAAALALNRPLAWPPGWVSISNFEMANALELVGSNKANSAISHYPGSTAPMFTIPDGVVQGWANRNFQVFGHGGAGEIGFYFYARHPDGTSAAGAWYGEMENIIGYGFGRMGIWLRGRSDSNNDAVNQFISFRGTQLFRPTASSLCWAITGKVGQITFSDACEFDSGSSGASIMSGYNVCVSREWRKSNGEPICAAENEAGASPVNGNQPYAIHLTATMQGSDGAVLLDRGALVIDKSDFENCIRCVDYQEAATLTFTNNELRNAAGSATSAGQGAICRMITASSLMTGNNLIEGYCDRSYVTLGGAMPNAFKQISPDRTAINLTGVSSNTMVVLSPSGFSIDLRGLSTAAIQGGSDANNRQSINNFTGQQGPGSEVTLVVHTGSYYRLASGGNLYINGELLLNPRDSFTIKWLDLYSNWQVINVVKST